MTFCVCMLLLDVLFANLFRAIRFGAVRVSSTSIVGPSQALRYMELMRLYEPFWYDHLT
jgi:hypothetical protein